MDEAVTRQVLRSERVDAVVRIRSMSGELEEIIGASRDSNGDDEHDPEGSTIAFERARVAALLGAALGYLDEIDGALGRLDAGTYGTCAQCGGSIDPDRLAARPATQSCIACAGTT
jgi:DnaK suppressor protein